MTRIVPALLIAMLLVPTATRADEEPFDKLVARVDAFYKEHDSFSARFEQIVTRAHLPDRPSKKSGRVYFKKPGKMRWDYAKPDQVFYVSDGSFLWNYIPESRLIYKLKVEDSELFYALRFLYGEGNLAKDFDLSDGGTRDGHRIVIVKPKESQQNFEVLELVVDPKDAHIDETILVDPAGNRSRLRFLKVSYDELPDKGFKFTPPEGVPIEEL